MSEVDWVEHLGDLLSSRDTLAVKSLLADDTFKLVLEERANDVIPIASFYLTQEAEENNPSVFRYAVKLVEKCAELGNPKECLMEFLAQMESLEEVKFHFLLKPLQTAMLRIPEKKAPLMLCAFNNVHSFINSLPLPDYQPTGGDSRLLLDCDENNQRIKDFYHRFVWFYTPFVEEVAGKPVSDLRTKNVKSAVLQALFHLLGKPLVFLDLEHHEKGLSEIRSISSSIVLLITKLQKDPIQLLVLVENKELISIEEEAKVIEEFSSNEFRFSNLSMAVFFYLIFCEGMYSSIPNVYSSQFILKNCLALAVTLLQYKDILVLRKGLLLIQTVLKNTTSGSVSFSQLDSSVDKLLIELLSTIAVYHEVEENRKLAAELIRLHFLAYEPKGKFYLLLNSSSIVAHPNITGFLTTMLTNTVQKIFNHSEFREYFTGKRLLDLLKQFCFLKKGAETDLMENKGQILSALNLVIFLTKRDQENLTGIWNYSSELQEHFLVPLREAVKLSRAHYELQLRTLEESPDAAYGPEFDVSVGGQMLSQMSTEEKKSVLGSSLTVFDLMEHLLSRAEECAAKETA